MLKVGLTGGIGSGKTLVAESFSNLEITVIDADQIAREIVAPNSKLLHEIVQHFGKQLLNKEGALDRKQLRKIIFYNVKEKKWLEELLHPVIYQRMEQLINQSSSPYCVLVIPLLFETNHEYFVDRILVVDTPEESQIERIVERDHTTKESVQKIIAMQINREQRLDKADDLILNTGSKKELNNQVKKLHQKYLGSK